MELKEEKGIRGAVKIITYRAGTKEIIRETEYTPNLVMLGTDTGKDLILDRLNGTNTYSLNITHGDIGTSATAPAITDTTLIAAVARSAKVVGSISTNVLTLQFFFADGGLANGTYREFGMFIDGTSTVSTGQIFNRALFGTPYVKASGEDTTVQVTITIT